MKRVSGTQRHAKLPKDATESDRAVEYALLRAFRFRNKTSVHRSPALTKSRSRQSRRDVTFNCARMLKVPDHSFAIDATEGWSLYLRRF